MGIIARFKRRCNAQILLVLLLFVWLMCTLLITAENEVDNRIRVFTVPEEVISQVETTIDPPRKHSCEDTEDGESSLLSLHHKLNIDRTDKSTAFVVWCQENQTFSFRHYLSLRSLLNTVQPDEIRFVYSHFPATDESGYHQWLQKLGQEYPFLRLIYNKNSCRNGVQNDKWIFDTLISKRGGFFLNPTAILKQSFHDVINQNLEALKLLDADNKTVAFSVTRSFALKNYKKTKSGISFFVNHSAINEIKLLQACDTAFMLPTMDLYKTAQNTPHCLITNAWSDDLYPHHIKLCDSQMCRYLQKLHYGYEHSKCSTDTSKTTNLAIATPNIVHYIHFGRFQFSFMFYLSVLSFIHIQKVEKVYIHCDEEPKGPMWTNLVKQEKDKLLIVHRSNPAIVYNQSISVIEHMADIAKADIAYKYGGILSDPDIIIVQKLKSEWFLHDAVVGLDIGSLHPFPDILNLGILICKPQSKFTRLWIESMKSFNDSNWLWNSGKVTYKIVENDPRLAVIESHLQVICYNFKCYPTWLPKHLYQNLDTGKDTLTHSLQNWTTQAYSFHFTFPEPFVSEAYLSKQTGIVGDVGRHVYKAAGLDRKKN